MKRILAIVVCLPVFLGLADASPITLFDSIDGSTAWLANSIVKSGYTGLFASFSTSASPFALQSVELALQDSAAPGIGGFTVNLVKDSSTSPTGGVLSVIATEPDTFLTTSLADYTFSTNIALAPNTRYWIEVLAGGNGSLAQWELTQTLSGPEVSTEYVANNKTFLAGLNTTDTYALEMDISGSNTPEPSTIFLGIIGLAILAAYRLRVRAVT